MPTEGRICHRNSGNSLYSDGWLIGEPLRGIKSMQPVNGFFLFRLGSIANLFGMVDGILLSTYEPVFQTSTQLITQFEEQEQNRRHLPDAISRAMTLRLMLQYCIGLARNEPATLVQIKLRMAIAHSLNAFQTALEQDLGKAHTFILEEKRGFAPKVLLNSVGDVILPKALPWLSHFTLTNLQAASAALVFDHFTSSGFLTMRAVEDTARRYYELVTGKPTTEDKPLGGRTFVTLGQIVWKFKNETLPAFAKAKTKTGKLGLIVPLLDTLCEMYRNPLSHPEIVTLDEDDAIEVFQTGIDVIVKMIRDVMAGGDHFHQIWHQYDFVWGVRTGDAKG